MKNFFQFLKLYTLKKNIRTNKLVIPPPPKNEFDLLNKYEKISVQRTNEIFKKQGRK